MRLQEKYKKEIIDELKNKFGYSNVMQVPKLQKIVLNVGYGRNAKDKAHVKNVLESLEAMTGQKPVTTKARKSISSFKIREGNVIGAKVTLRGKKMWDFIDKLINITFPRVRDFRGIPDKGIDAQGNMTIGFKEHTPFPEINVDDIENVFGLEVCLTTSAKSKDEGLELFRLMGFPFKKK